MIRALLDAIETYVAVLDRQGRVVLVNKAVERATGVAPDDLRGRDAWNALCREDESDPVRVALRGLWSGETPVQFESHVGAERGGRLVTWTGAVLPSDGDVGGHALCSGIDVTELRETKATLQERTYELNERIKELHCLYEISSLVQDLDAELGQILQGIVDLIPPAWQYPDAACARITLDGLSVQTRDFAETTWKQSREIMVGGKPVGALEVCYRSAKPQRDEGPFLKEERSLINVIAERIEEVVERKAAAAALKDSEELHRMTLSNISDAVFITDDRGAFTYVCSNVHVLFGYSQEEVSAFGRISALLGQDVFDPGELAKAGEIPNIERMVTDKGGVQHDLLVNVKRVSIQGGSVLYTCRDVTALKRAEEQLRRQQTELAHVSRLSTMGEMASGLAHELNQPLSAIVNYSKGCARRLASKVGNTDELAGVMHQVAAEAERAGEIVRRLRSFVQKKESRRAEVDVNEMVREALALVSAEARHNSVAIRFEPAESLPLVSADVVQVQQVIVNLTRNALDAMADVDPAARRLIVRTSASGSGAIEIVVCDSGHGVPAALADRIFDPFFSTKPEGMGVGLSISKSIIEAHGGQLRSEPNPDGGMTFRFELPARTNS